MTGRTASQTGSGETVIAPGAELLMRTTNTKWLSQRTLRNLSQTGTSEWNNGWLYLYDDGVFINDVDALFTFNPASGVRIGTSRWGSVNGRIENLGTLTHSGLGEFEIGTTVNLTQSGVMLVESGLVDLHSYFDAHGCLDGECGWGVQVCEWHADAG